MFFTSKKYHQIPYNRNPVNQDTLLTKISSKF
jgi:hypothetical protein